jgi:hypothetical protein
VDASQDDQIARHRERDTAIEANQPHIYIGHELGEFTLARALDLYGEIHTATEKLAEITG